MDSLMSMEDLIVQRAIMLQKRPEDLLQVQERVLKSQWESVKQLKKMMKNKIHDFDFKPGSLVVIRNSKFNKTLSDKTKPRYFGPMVVIKRTKGGSYVLGEMDGSLSKLHFATFHLFPYQLRDIKAVPVTKFVDELRSEVEDFTHDSGNQLDNKVDEELWKFKFTSKVYNAAIKILSKTYL